MAPKSAERSSKSVESAESTTETTDKVSVTEEWRASTAALVVARLFRDTEGEILITIKNELPSDKQYFRFEGVIEGLLLHALPSCVVNIGRVPNVRAPQASLPDYP